MTTELSTLFGKLETRVVAIGEEVETFIEPYALLFFHFFIAVYNASKPAITADILTMFKNGIPLVIGVLTTGGDAAAGEAALKYILGIAPTLAEDIAKLFAQTLVVTAKSTLPQTPIIIAVENAVQQALPASNGTLVQTSTVITPIPSQPQPAGA